ncbi:IS701-like element ISDge5 family transposase, partial [Deinococcus sp. S9]
MSNSQILGERARILADQLLAVPTTVYQQRSLQAALHLFLDTGTKTALHRAPLVSKSAVSRLLNNYDWDTAACWALLQRSQWEALLLAARRKRRACLRLSVDLTSIEKTGKQLPFVRVYNEVHGIHLVVLFAEYRGLKFPVGYRVYRGKGTATPVSLALELLGEVPDAIRKRFRIRVLADSGFEAAVFL